MPKIREIASIPVYCVRENDDLNHARQEMLSRGVDKLVVLNSAEEAVGLVTVTDLVQDGANLASSEPRRLHVRQGRVRDVMTRDVFTMKAENDAANAIEDFARRDIVAAPVMDDGELVGIVTAHDLLPVVRERLNGKEMTRNVMDPDVVRLHRHDSLAHAAHAIAKAHAGAAVVTETEGGVATVGVVTLESILFHAALEPTLPDGKRIESTRKPGYGSRKSARHVDHVNAVVEDAMWPEHPTLQPDSGANQAANVMTSQKVDVVPVVDADAVVGMVTKRHLLGAAARAIKAQA